MSHNAHIDGAACDTLIQLLRVRAEEGSDHGFVFLSDARSPEVRLSFVQLDRQARALAGLLQRRGLTGQRALLCYPPGVDFLVGLFGCLYAGVVAVPVYPPRANRSDVRLESIAENSGAVLALTSTKVFRDRGRLTSHTPRLGHLDWLDTCEISENEAARWMGPGTRRRDLAVLQYTSGSTGLPKGVMLTHGALLHNLMRMREILGLTPETDGVCWLPAFHDMGLIGNLLQTVYCGASLISLPPTTFAQDPLLWLQTISSRRAYVSGGPTFAFRHCVQRMTAEKCQGLDLSCWKVAYVGAEPVSSAALDGFAEAFATYGFRREAFFPCYGLAEATLMVTGGDRAAPPVVRSFSRAALGENRAESEDEGQPMVGCGRPLLDLDVRIVDPVSAESLPEGGIGEIWVSGPSIAGGYWDRPDESALTFQARCRSNPDVPFLRTGDMGFFHEGELFISGRCKDLIISRGRNYYPHDLEAAAVDACPELSGQAGAAFTIEAEIGAQLAIVQEVPREYRAGTGEELFARIRERIAELFELELHKLLLVKIGTIPRASSGKVQRQECARRYQSCEFTPIEELTSACGPDDHGQAPSPVDIASSNPQSAIRNPQWELRDWLVRRLARHLKVGTDSIDIHKPWAAYGLDSLALSTLAAELQHWLGRPLSPTLLYSAPTIDSLVRALTNEAGNEGASSPAGDRGLMPIAVIGVGCRFPQADGPEETWQLLRSGRCVIGELPAGRWERAADSVATTQGGYLDDVPCFDAPFFGIGPREAAFIDPQHRLLLEVAWSALEHAGLPADRLAGRPVGVFVGISTNDYGRLLVLHDCAADACTGIGNSSSMAAHRLSYHLDLQGPSVAVDTACSSSLVAVHLACQSLRGGECEIALAGGVNLILTPELTEVLSRGGMLSPTGRCRTFDAAADGYVRGEGCGIVVLKPLPAALRDGDRILAVVEASAVNQDGRSNGITAPNGARQAELIRRVLQLARRAADDVSCVEAHGTGTPLGDPIEFDALQAALGSSSTPCALASIKTNLGHLEAAAGIAGLIKTVLQVHHGQIVPHLHLESLNPRIGLAGSRFYIPRQPTDWPDQARPHLAGVSSFGFGGTNAHVLVGPAPVVATVPGMATTPGRLLHLLPLSARSEAALKALARRWADWLRHHPDIHMEDVCAAAGEGRCHFEHRLTVSGADGEHLAAALAAWTDMGHHPACRAGQATRGLSGRVAFLFTGQGAQYVGMGQKLYEMCPIFRSALDRCAVILDGLGIGSLHEVLRDAGGLEQTESAQPALFAVEYALAQMWQAWGIEPAALLGHSAGEYVAACVAGVLSLEDALKLLTHRARLMQACADGVMLACFAPLEDVRRHVERWGGRVEIAAINGPESIVVAGYPAETAALREELAARGIESRLLHVRRAFHSALIEPALPQLRQLAATLPHRSPPIPLVSNLTGRLFTEAPAPDYWAAHARQTVQFAVGVRTLHEAGITHFLEIGPDAVLCRLGPACLATAEKTVWLASLRRGADDWTEVLDTINRLYVDGEKVHWGQVDGRPHRPHVDLPTYPFERRPYWVDMIAPPRSLLGGTGVSPVTPPTGGTRVTPGTAEAPRWRPWSNWRQRLPRKTEFDVLPGGLKGTVAPVLPHLRAKHAIEQFLPLREEFDRLAGAYVVTTLRQLGWTPCLGEVVEVESLAERLKVVLPYNRLLGRLLQMAAEDGWLEPVGAGWRVIRTPVPADVAAGHLDLLARYPGFEADLKLAHRCGSRMHRVMRGEAGPLDVLFGDEAASWTERLYRESPMAHFYNDLVAGCLRELIGRLPGQRPIHILEVGAGTGGTTAHVLPVLPRERVEYVFTDVSRLFVSQAALKFQQSPCVHYHTLDLEKAPDPQGFADGQFDLVLAANVLHATSDLRRSIRNARRLLAPGGVLILLEGTGPRRLLDLIFGLTEGWWKFADLDLRPRYPLLPPAAWEQLLIESGFQEVTAVPAADSGLSDPDQVVVLALNDTLLSPPKESGCEPGVETSPPRVWTVTCGAAPFHPEMAVPSEWPADFTLQAADERIQRIDLDAEQSPADQMTCLCQALRHPDDQPLVVYRGGQRYIPVPEERERTGENKVEKTVLLNRDVLRAAAPSDRRRLIDEYLRRQLDAVLGLDISPSDMDRPLQAFGLDSLTGIQLRNLIDDQLGVSLSVVDFLKGLSLRQIGERALAALADMPNGPNSESKPKAPPLPDITREKVDQLPVERLDGLLDSLLG